MRNILQFNFASTNVFCKSFPMFSYSVWLKLHISVLLEKNDEALKQLDRENVHNALTLNPPFTKPFSTYAVY